ncbi:MAG: right-handed parallel beta-helix repeat-containing protein [Methanobacteriaceae archaeon]|nr:right-handed parallel beta-helix repeat-containing protein [Methanobacteriaceae archaeon]
MIKKNKFFLFSICLLLLVVIGSTVVSATDDTSLNTTLSDSSLSTTLEDNSNIVSDSAQTDSVKSNINEVKNVQTQVQNTKTITKTNNKEISSDISSNSVKSASSSYQVTPSTYSTYFGNDTKIKTDVVKSGDVLNLNGEFKDVGFTINIPINMTSVKGQTTILNGSINLIAGADGTNVSNIDLYRTVAGNSSTGDNCVIHVSNVSDITVTNCYSNYTGTARGVVPLGIDQGTTNSLFENNVIIGCASSTLVVGNTNNVTLLNNTIATNPNSAANVLYLSPYSTGSFVGGVANNINIINNTVLAYPGGWCQSVVLCGNNHTISGNKINGSATGIAFAYGGSGSNINIYDNDVNGSIAGMNGLVYNNNATSMRLSTGVTAYSNTIKNSLTLAGNVTAYSNIIQNGTVSITSPEVIFTNNIVNSENEYAVTLTSTGNTVTNNILVAKDKKGNNAVSGIANNTVKGNIGSTISYIVTDATYSSFFDENSTIRNNITAYSTLYYEGNFTNKNFIINIPVSITSGNVSAIINNGSFIFNKGSDNSELSNIEINDYNYVDDVIVLNNTSNILINEITLNQENTQSTSIAHGIHIIDSHNNQIINSLINVKGPSANIAYNEYYEPSVLNTTSIYVDVDSTNNVIKANVINVLYNNISGSWDSIDGITIDGTNNTFSNNVLTVVGHSYAYGVDVRYMSANNTVSNNVVLVFADEEQATGLNIASTGNKVNNNVVTANGTVASYGAIVSAMGMGPSKLNTITANVIYATAENAYGIELYQSDLNTITNNAVIANGKFALGIVGYGSDNNTVRNNEISTTGTGATATKISDAITPDNVGIGFYHNSIGNKILSNTIEVTNTGRTTTKGIHLSNSDNNTITSNTITVTGPECNIIYDENYNPSPVNTTALYLDSSNNNEVTKNTINTKSNTVYQTYSTIESIDVNGNGNTIDANDITTTGTNYVYGVVVNSNATDNTISRNKITTNANKVSEGIEIILANDNVLTGNQIFVNAKTGYGIYVTDNGKTQKTEDVTISDNSIYVNSEIGYGIELYGTKNIEIRNNMINILGSGYTNNYGLGIIGSNVQNTTVNTNIITVISNGAGLKSNLDIVDNLGIGLYQNSSDNTVANNVITVNNFGIGTTRGVIISKSENNIIASNVITVSGPECDIIYDENYNPSPVNTTAITIDSSNKNIIYDNSINTISNAIRGNYSTIESICINGAENQITNNYISTSGFNYGYGITLNIGSNDNIITGNVIDTISKVAEGIQIIESENNIVKDNSIKSTGNIGYGIYITDNSKLTASNNTLSDNLININANISYGIELYGADNTEVTSNIISIGSKNSPSEFGLGIVGSNADDNTINDNTINIISNSEKVISSYDVIDNVGIGLYTGSTGNIINMNKIFVTNTGNITTRGIIISGSDKNTMDSNEIKVTGPECNVVYDEEFKPISVNTSAVWITGNENLLLNNDISVISNNELGKYSTIEAVIIKGDNNTISSNKISSIGKNYVYGIDIEKGSNKIIENDISSIGVVYANAIQAFINGVKEDSQVTILNNTVEALATNFTYGVYVDGKGANTDVIISNNDVNVDSKIARGIELLSINGVVNNNSIIANGDYTMGIIGYEIANTVIDSNDVQANGNATYVVTNDFDEIKATNIGIILLKSNNTVVTNNDIVTKAKYTVDVNGVNNNITDNYLVAKELKGDSSVNATTGNIVKNNLPSNKISTIVSADNIVSCAGKNVTFSAIVTDENGNLVASGKVAFKLNGNTIGYGQVKNGIVTFNYVIPSNYAMKNYIITVKYGGNNKYESSSDEAILTLGKQETSIVTKDIVSQAGKTVAFTATVSDLVKDVINNGKVVFKLNGKTIGTANVTGNKATLNYLIPSNYSAKNYTITAKYSGSNTCESSTTNATLTLTKATASSDIVYTYDDNFVMDNQTSVVLI